MMQELSLSILDLAENSISAGARLIVIRISERADEDMLTITLEDDGCGMDGTLLSQAASPFTTTRATRRIGLGIPMMKQGAESCGGSFEIASSPGVGTTLMASFRLSHIDRPPMGDLAGTLLSLIIASPQGPDIALEYRVGDSAFEFDTRPVRAVMGEVPLTSPEVLEWISGALKEGIDSLNGGA